MSFSDVSENLSQLPVLIRTKHYDRYPHMHPWVGKHYREGGILLIGESHYAPASTNINRDPEDWYSGSSSTLSGDDLRNICTIGVINHMLTCKFNRPYTIFYNVVKGFSAGLRKETSREQVFNRIMFYNYFQRPAANKLSIWVQDMDREVSRITLREIANQAKPRYLLFVSLKAFAAAKESGVVQELRDEGRIVEYFPHPSSAWWNRESRHLLNRATNQPEKGRQRFEDFVRAHFLDMDFS